MDEAELVDMGRGQAEAEKGGEGADCLSWAGQNRSLREMGRQAGTFRDIGQGGPASASGIFP